MTIHNFRWCIFERKKIMEKNKIKKVLYKERPIAIEVDDGVSGIRGASAVTASRYEANTSIGKVEFYVPHHEMGANKFEKELPAQLLIRWIIIRDENGIPS